MIISKYKKIELKEQIRYLLLSKQKLSCVVVGKEIGVSKDYANKLLNEVIKENIELTRQSIEESSKRSFADELALLESDSNVLIRRLWEVIKTSNNQEKIRAIQTIYSMKKGLVELKSNVGIFKPNTTLEGVSVPELVTLIRSIEKDSISSGNEQSL